MTHESDYTCMVCEFSNAEHKHSSWLLRVRWFSENSAETHITLLRSTSAWTMEVNIYSLSSCDTQLKYQLHSLIYYYVFLLFTNQVHYKQAFKTEARHIIEIIHNEEAYQSKLA